MALKKLVAEIHELPVKEQVSLMKETFTGWKKDLDQVDDVTIAVLRF